MCTVVAHKRGLPAPRLVVAANRDELYARPTLGPRLLRREPRVVGGLDALKGGTWMGASERGLFVALTNQRGQGLVEPGLRSRGEVVLRALGQPDVEAIDALLASLDPGRYAGFNLLYGDARTLRVAYARPERPRLEIETLGDGLWVLPNDRIGSADFPKVRRVEALAAPLAAEAWSEVEAGARRLLADHLRPPLSEVPPPPPGSPFDRTTARELQAICVHTPVYGTRSSTLLELRAGRVERYLHADGPPCRSAFEDVTALLR